MEDVIELGSSDEEPGPPPHKKVKTVSNAMVHIPSKIHGVTIKPVKASTNSAKLFAGKNITVTKISNAEAQIKKAKQIKPPDRLVNKTIAKIAKKKTMRKPIGVPSKGTVLNPLSQIKKTIPQTVVHSLVTKLNKPIQILGAPALPKLPPSVTVRKTVATVSKLTNFVTFATGLQKTSTVTKKRKVDFVPTVELDDEETTTSTESPQWYMRPEEQNKTNKKEKTNTMKQIDKEPEKPGYIEITIEDSPIKPTKSKRTRELSIENVITIDDSPNKVGPVNAEAVEGIDNELNTSKDVPKSKKKLIYNNTTLENIEEICTLEIEFDQIDKDESSKFVRNDSKIVSVTPDKESSVEIAQNQQGEVSVVKTRAKDKTLNIEYDKDESEFEPNYLNFINLCLKLENSEDMKKIVDKKIKTYYRQVPKEYTQSEEFIDMVSSKVSSIKAAPEKMYLFIKDIVDELNLQRKLAKQTPIQEAKPKDVETFSFSNDGNLDPSKQRQIRKLEKTLKKLNRAIQKLEMQEVDFDDEEDSVYLLTEKYKERMVRVHAKFCQLTNSKMPSEPRLVIDPRPGQPFGPAKRLEAWINKTTPLAFPDFHDVLRCVREANNDDKLGWNEAFIMEEARDLFVRCGKKLQRRRQEREWRLATSRLTTNEDPAEESVDLKKQLEDNRRLANTKESEVLNRFSDRQNKLKLEAEEIDDEAEESPVESEEDENDESSVLESKQRRKERIRRLLQEQSKKNPFLKPQVTEGDNIGAKVNKTEATDYNDETKDKKQNSDNDDSNIHSLSDDSNEIGSDIDELHLLQKLHSDNEMRNVSTAESSDSETPIAISDSLDSTSDEGTEDKKKEQPCDVVSIENSSYSEESDSQQNVARKINKKLSVSNMELMKGRKEVESTSASSVKGIKFSDDPLNDVLITSSDGESNSPELSTSDSKNSERMFKESSLHGHGNDPLISLDSKTITSISSNSEDNSDNKSTNVAEKREKTIECEWDNTSSEKNMGVEEHRDYSSSHTMIIVEQLEGSSKQSDESQSGDAWMNSKNDSPITSEEVLSGLRFIGDIDKALASSIHNLASTSNVRSKLEDISTSYSVKSIRNDIDEKSNVIKTTVPIKEGIAQRGDSDAALKGNDVPQSVDVYTEPKDGDTCNSKLGIEGVSEILITSVVSTTKVDQIDESLKGNVYSNQTLENLNDCGNDISNGNSNSNLDIPDHSGTNLSEKNDFAQKEELTEFSIGEGASMEKPLSEQSESVEKILEDMFQSEITAVEAPITLSPT